MAAIQETLARGEDDEGMLDVDLSEFVRYFDALDLDLRRALEENKLAVTVSGKTHGDRVSVKPKH